MISAKAGVMGRMLSGSRRLLVHALASTGNITEQ
jgi:hypothetical protein